jgi:hypothetical protein
VDNVAKLLDQISQLPEMASLDGRAGKFLNEVAEIYERHGAGVTEAYLLNQQGKKREVPLLAKVLRLFQTCPPVGTNRGIGRQIIKCLFELKKGARR